MTHLHCLGLLAIQRAKARGSEEGRGVSSDDGRDASWDYRGLSAAAQMVKYGSQPALSTLYSVKGSALQTKEPMRRRLQTPKPLSQSSNPEIPAELEPHRDAETRLESDHGMPPPRRHDQHVPFFEDGLSRVREYVPHELGRVRRRG